MPNIYFYKLTVDDGGAPCVENDLLSLAICKPMIRSTATKGDIVIGFAANSLHPDNRLIYVARVNDKLVNGDYFRPGKYNGRADCIYEWRGGRFAARAGAIYHSSPKDLAHDLGEHPDYPRANTLLSREFCYFGGSGSDAYKKAFPIVAKAVAALGRGHRVHHDPGLLAELERLARWSCALNGACVQGQPTGKPRRGVSHRGGGCGVAKCQARIKP
jgi:hypothetical protein